MEKPYQGRAVLRDSLTELQIQIPAHRPWFVIAFLSFWLCGWLLGELSVIGALTGLQLGWLAGMPSAPMPVSAFLLVWLGGWTVGGLFALRALLWMVRGQEVITAGSGTLTVDKAGMLFYKAKTYDLAEVRNVRVQEDVAAGFQGFGTRRNSIAGFGDTGTIRFDYGLKTVKFGAGIDEAEARFLVGKLRERRVLTDRNFGA